MAKVTYYVVLPFIRNEEGDLFAIEAEEALDVAKAKFRAFNMVGHKRGDDVIVGAIAFSRTGDPATGDFGDALILSRHGEAPENLEGIE
ncbi:hypothetical protein ACETRX_04070 [Labrys portucalensis]|uniref:DUF1428 domain-containing protein n=1 Tax=Labrys neptuniae TaxID=376174 RepID=A0ABV6Z9D3_9HYPH